MTLILREILGTSITSRVRAEVITAYLKNNPDVDVIDFEGVTFISRSFADEFYQIMRQIDRPIEVKGENSIVTAMLAAVQKTNTTQRVRPVDNPKIKSFSRFEDLSEYLLST